MKYYKESYYNYFIDYQNKKLLFNGLTGAGFCMMQEEYKSLYLLMQQLSVFQEKYPDDFDRLRNLGYIIEDDFDEIAYMKFKNRQATFIDKAYRLTINPTLECNFNCWYCYESHPKGYMSKKTMIKIKRHIKFMIEKEKIQSLQLDWFGGEPLLYFYEVIYPIAIYAKKLCKQHKIPYFSNITTNVYCLDEKMIPYLEEIQAEHFQITLDGDRERHNKIRNHHGKPSYDKIIQNINLLCERLINISITMRVNYDEKTLGSNNIYSVLEDIYPNNRSKISVNMQRVWQTFEKKQRGQGKNEPMLAFMQKAREIGFKIAYSGGGIAIGTHYTCYVSRYYHTEINYDGKVYKCTARDYKPEYEMGILRDDGQIIWNTKKLSKMYANSTFENQSCLSCKYLPICNGPCPQKIMELDNKIFSTICVKNYKEQTFEDVIIDFHKHREEKLLLHA